jgi:hypothetical protein
MIDLSDKDALMAPKSKIEQVLEYRPYCKERHYKAVYLNALRTNNASKIAYCESFGNEPRKIIMNMRAYYTALRFGFKCMPFNDNGWLHYNKLFEREDIEFIHKKNHVACNAVILQKAPNGLYVVGISHSAGCSGSHWVPDIWAREHEIFNDRHTALVWGLKELLRKHNEAESPEPWVVRDVTAIIKSLTQPQQQTLF